MQIDANSTIAAGTTATLVTNAVGDAIDLGSAVDGGGGTLELSDAELDTITATTLVIGSATQGDITVSAALTPANDPAIQLISNNGTSLIQDSFTGGADITVTSLTTNGDLNPGTNDTAGIFNVAGAHTMADGSTFTVEIGGTTPGTNQDQVDATGAVNIGTGTVTLATEALGAFTPTTGEFYEIVNRTGGTGTIFLGTTTPFAGENIISNFLGSTQWGNVNYAGGDGDDIVIEAVEPEIGVSDQTGPTVLADNASTVDFGLHDVADTVTRTFRITNTGSRSLEIGAITFTGVNADDFAVTSAPATVIGRGDTTATTTDFDVTFTVKDDGARSATMNIASNDLDETTFEVALIGEGSIYFTGSGPVTANGEVVVTADGFDFDTRGINFDIELGYAPTVGDTIVAIQMVQPGDDIIENFNDFPDGGVVALGFGGVVYYYQADYNTGGDNNDLVLTNYDPTALGDIEWTWVSGTNKRNPRGSFGTQGVAGATNAPGGRQGGMQWLAQDGNLYVYGGYGYAGTIVSTPRWINDLWRYDRTSGQWTWMKGGNIPIQLGVYGTQGVPAAQNSPGARHTGTTWTDRAGDLWLFGGRGVGTGRHNDLWRYDLTTGGGDWTWMKGSNTTDQAGVYGAQGVEAAANTPGARQGSVSWVTEDGRLWLFGGFDASNNYYNDLWSYNTATNNWTWVSGSNLPDQPSGAEPGARRDATAFLDRDGSTLWLFGGRGSSAGSLDDLNDIWSYDTGTDTWTEVMATGAPASYVNQGNFDAAANPGPRSAAGGWVTAEGYFWLIGGFDDALIPRNDVWKYNPDSGEWMWLLGSDQPNVASESGVQGTPAAANLPGARFTPVTWVTLNGTLWSFGGGGKDVFGGNGRMNDLWHYKFPNPAGAALPPPPLPFPDELVLNAPPNANNAVGVTMASVPVAGAVSGSDPDGDVLNFQEVGETLSQGTLELQPDGSWVYVPAPGFVGQETFTFTAADSYGGESGVRTIQVTVNANPADTDNDGIADAYEEGLLGAGNLSLTGDGDADFDGQSNYMEFLAGTNAIDATEFLLSAPTIGSGDQAGSLLLELNHVRPGVKYHLEWSPDMSAWQLIGTFEFSTAGSVTLEDEDPPEGVGSQFYRVRLEPTPALFP